ncbi:hypothetical protein BHE74_00017558 [Ensete ventricosum]|nr:hypothetical protein BHE74_00017558 [Ensete ventricosum]RZS22748.1 hypothetical protein BHM03_00055575 [Ensete ventricosum]
MAVAIPGSLYIGSVVVGLCYGVRLAVSVPTASELFGLKYYGLIYNILILNLPLGSFLFSGLLAGLLYDAQATKTEGGANTCVGAHCYRMVFVIMALACIIGFGLDRLPLLPLAAVASTICSTTLPAIGARHHSYPLPQLLPVVPSTAVITLLLLFLRHRHSLFHLLFLHWHLPLATPIPISFSFPAVKRQHLLSPSPTPLLLLCSLPSSQPLLLQQQLLPIFAGHLYCTCRRPSLLLLLSQQSPQNVDAIAVELNWCFRPLLRLLPAVLLLLCSPSRQRASRTVSRYFPTVAASLPREPLRATARSHNQPPLPPPVF